MKKIIVTGANGFVCSNIIDVLVAQGWFVYAVDMTFDNPATAQWSDAQVERVQSDVQSLPPLAVDALLHGAAITSSAETRGEAPEDNFMANLQPALAMLRYAQTHDIDRAIFMSSSAVYRTTAGQVPEEQPAAPRGMYAVAKYTIEGLVETLRHDYQRDVLCIRLGNLYGLHEYKRASRAHVSLVQQCINRALNQAEIIVDTRLAPREWTFAPDVGAAVLALLQTDVLSYAVYNVAAGAVHSPREIADAIQAVLPDVDIITRTPDGANDDTLARHGTLDTHRLRTDTGFDQWTSLQAGIRRTLAALAEEANHDHA